MKKDKIKITITYYENGTAHIKMLLNGKQVLSNIVGMLANEADVLEWISKTYGRI